MGGRGLGGERGGEVLQRAAESAGKGGHRSKSSNLNLTVVLEGRSVNLNLTEISVGFELENNIQKSEMEVFYLLVGGQGVH